MTTDPPPPRRNWHFNRWLIVLIVAMFGWSGWRAYAFRSALSQAEALGWYVEYTDPIETIRADWKAVFKKATWLDGVTIVDIPPSEAFEQHLAIVHRLNPKALRINNAATLRDLSALNGLTQLQGITVKDCTSLTHLDALMNLSTLQSIWLTGCTSLTDVDALKNLSALRKVHIFGCIKLTNVDALKNLPALQQIWLSGCRGLTKESVAALKAALPKARITAP